VAQPVPVCRDGVQGASLHWGVVIFNFFDGVTTVGDALGGDPGVCVCMVFCVAQLAAGIFLSVVS